ncbi:molybdate ABC transporter permease subunit [Paenibacillus sambharensis]|uniref:Molybdenum transport system permease n=1 Tax=Paenibacillus sambharensis TaxID=1803190 RepID=A0A2W1LA66_9BACL|nr:molybdate ABC transporter permease subunit [Paenibacillus sambharensis]PZD96116.1 molybdate ABC transporter permease subunit [Paenibacillus sambharensis]
MHDWSVILPPIAISIKVALASSLIVFLAAAAAARWMSRASFPGKTIIETLLLLPLVLPPTVVGFVLLMALGRRSWLGQAYEWLTGQPIIFTWGAAVIAAAVVAFPLAYRTMRAGFDAVDQEVEDAARAQGAGEWQVFRHITAPLAYRSLTGGYILGFARGLGEFGATLMIAGNIPGRTQTIPTAIFVAVEGNETLLAWIWAGAIVLFSFLMLLLAGLLERR